MKFGATTIAGWAAAASAALVATAAAAQSADPEFRIGQSAPGQLNLQEPATLVARQIYDLHTFMLWISAAICVFVLALLAIVIVRYNRRANPHAQSWTHNTALEVAWTVVPVFVLVAIAIPSVRLLQLQEDFDRVEPDIVIKATGFQWYWGYEYAGLDVEMEAFMLGKGHAEMNEEVRQELAEFGYPESAWLLATDTALVVPVDATVLVQVTAADVIHSWTIPSFGVKADGVPGRINQTWFRAEHEGIYFGQCSELCGRDHSFMPITVKVVSQEAFDEWVSCVQAGDVSDCATPTMIDPPEATAEAGPSDEVELAAAAAR